MNRIYRLVFNCTLRVWQVASELVRSKGGMTAGGGGVVAATVPKLRFAMWLSLGWVMLAPSVLAQDAAVHGAGRIVGDPDAPGRQRPTVLQAPNGVPLVNIATPSAAGVSRNAYRQFDVGTEGAILNNARTAVQTELGGRVQGNPWLAGGTARIILNEVNSAAPSHLHGYVEVAGDRAQVIIANPAGIQVDGGGFLNASRVTLSTGAPIFNGDALTGYRVENGSIRIDGVGLDATRTDYTGLIARAVEVNAGIWAQQLQVTTGANTVSADLSQSTAIAGAAAITPAPALALDVSALGGMYAGKITLLGTEQGLGVRNAGTIGAQAGELTVTVDGRLENTGAMQSRDSVAVAATGGVRNAGTLSAAREVSIATSQALDNSGGTLNAARLAIDAGTLQNRGGAIEQTGLQTLAVEAGDVRNRDGGRIGIAEADDGAGGAPGSGGSAGGGAPETPDSPGGSVGTPDSGGGGGTIPLPAPLDPGALRIAGTLDNDGGRINAGGGIDLSSANGLDNEAGRVGVRSLDVQGGELRNRDGSVSVSGATAIQVDRIDNAEGRIEAAGALALGAGAFDNRGGFLAHSGTAPTVVRVDGVLDNADGTIASNAAALELAATVLVNESGEIVHAGEQGLRIDTDELRGPGGRITTAGAAVLNAGYIDNRDGTLSAARLDVLAGGFDNRAGRVVVSGDDASRLDVSGRVDNRGGMIASTGDLDLRATSFDNAAGRVQHAGDGTLSIAAETLDGAGGTIASNGALVLSGETLDLRDGTTQARSIAVDGGDLTTAGGQLVATGEAALRLHLRGALDNEDGTIATNGALELVADSASNRGGAIQSAGAGRASILVSGVLDNSAGVLAAAGDADIAAADLRNAAGTLQAGGGLHLGVDGAIDNSAEGLIAASDDMSLQTDVLHNTDGTIQHAGDGTLAIDTRVLDGAGGTIAGNGALHLTGDTLNLRDGTTQAQTIAVEAGDLTTEGGSLIATGDDTLQLKLRGTLNNDAGTIATNGALDLVANAASNRGGTLQAAGDGATQVRVTHTFDNTDGTLAAVGDTRVDAGRLINAGGLLQAAGESTLQVSVDGLLDNSDDGLIVAGGDTTIGAGTLDNTDGAIQHAGNGTLAIDADVLNGTGGTIVGNGSLVLTGGTLDLRDGATQARVITVDADALTTAGGTLVASGEDALRLRLQGALDNDGGTIATNGALDLTAGAASNRGGTIQAAGAADTAVRITATFDNTGGLLAAAGDTTIAAGRLLNVGGVVQAVEDADLVVHVDGLLDNSNYGLIAASGEMTLDADILDNTDGTIQHAGDGTLAIDTRLLDGSGGTIAGNGTLLLTGETLNLRDGTTQAQSIAIDGGDLTTAGGRLVATGDEALHLQLRGTLNNDAGTIATNGALDLVANAASNRGGTLQAAGNDATRVQVTNRFDNTDGILAAVGDTRVDAGSLINAGGLLQAAGESTLQVSVDGLLDNSDDGLIVAGGDTTIGAGMLDNTDGAIQHAGEGTLAIDADVLNGASGTIVGNGHLALSGGTLDLRDGTTQARSINVDAGALTTAGGSLIASGDDVLRLRLQGALDNDGGTIATNGAVDLTAGAVSNRDGTLQAAGAGDSAVRVATTFDNTGGVLAAAGDTTIAAGQLRNVGGVVQAVADAELVVRVDGLLDNSNDGLIAASGEMTLDADFLDNTDGTIQHAGDGTLAIDTRVLDGSGGTIASNGALQLRGDTLNLRDGTTQAQSIAIDGGDLTTAGGSLVATGDEALRLQLRGTLNNDAGTIATNGALDLVANAASNRGGTLQAAGAGATQVRVTNAFDNTDGTLAAVGDTRVDAGSLINVGGLLQAAGESTLQVSVDGLLDNSGDGLIVAGGDTTIDAGTLDNTGGAIQHVGEGTLAIEAAVLSGAGGTIVGNGALVITGENTNLRGGTTSARSISIETGALTTADGTLVATGNEVLRLDVRGTLNNAGGMVATNGGLDLDAGALDNREGTVQAAGAAAADVRVAGRLDNSGGLLTTAGATTLRAGELINTGGALAATDDAPLQVTVDGRLVNDAGSIESNGAIALASQSLSNIDGVVRTQQAISLTVDDLLDNTRGAVIAGGDLTVGAGTLRNRDTFDPAVTAAAAQRGLFGGRVVLDAASIDNTRGQVNAGNGLQVTGGALANAGGRIDATGAMDVTVASFGNAGGRLTQRGNGGALDLVVSGTLDNAGGFVGADGNATLRANQLDNTAGTLFTARHLDVSIDRDLHNRAGGLLQSNAGMTLAAGGTFDNSDGGLDATGDATLSVGQLANQGGQLLAGAAGQAGLGLNVVSAGNVDNRGGTIGSRGGDLAIQTGTIDNSAQGTLVSGRDLALQTQSINNTGGTVYAGRDLTWQNGAGILGNSGGRFGASGTARLSVNQVDNRDGGRIQADTLWLDVTRLENAGGEVSANTLHAELSALNGGGRIYGAQWLNLHFTGDYTYASGQYMDSNGRLGLTVTGTFTNQGTLQSSGELSLSAGNVINDTGGTINASNASGTGVNRITAEGFIENRTGASLEGDTLLLTARDVVNTGDIVGDTVGIEADTLTNGRDLGNATAVRDYGEGFIGAAELLELRIGQRLSNLDGELYSGGDLLISGRADGTRVGLLDNVSGRIQAERDLDIAADTVINERRVVVTEHRAYVGDEQFDDPDAGSRYENSVPGSLYDQFCPPDPRTRCTHFSGNTSYYDRVLEGTRVVAASAAAQLLSGRDMRIDTGRLDNQYAQIAAGRNLAISGRTSSDGSDPGSWTGVVNNVALSGYKIIESGGTAEVQYQRCSVDYDCQFEPTFATVELGTETWRKDVVLVGASITAGQNVSIVGGDISNTVVGAGGGLAAIGPGAVSGPGSTALGTTRGATARRLGNVGSASGDSASGGGSVDATTGGTVDGTGRLDRVDGGTASGGGAVQGVGGNAVIALTGPLSVMTDTANGGDSVGGAFASLVATRALPEGAAAQVVGGPERPLPGLVPPDNGMFDIVSDPNSPFLVRTAPRFVPGDTTGSDYLLDRIGASTDQHKRLGDAAYEQRLVLEQLMALTGRRALDGSDGLGQYRALMDNASQVADDLGLLLGSPLTVTQIGALDQDIVWLVEQVIDGQTVLVPVVYLSRATAERLRGDNALIAGGDVKIQSSTTVRNDGTLEANQGLWLSADTLINDGALRAGNRLDIATTGDTVNRGELIGGAVSVDAGRDVLNTGSIVANSGSAVVMAGRDFVQSADGRLSAAADAVVAAGRDLTLQASANAVGGHSVSRIDAGGDLALVAGRDLTLQASKLAAGDNLVLQAGQDLRLEALSNTRTLADNRSSSSITTHQVVDIQAGGDAALSAGRDALLQGSRVDAAGALALVAGRDIDIQAVVDERSFETQGAVRRGSYQRSEFNQTVRGAELTAGSDIAIVGGRDVTLGAAYVGSQTGGVAIGAGRDLSLTAAEEQHNFEQTTQTKKSGFLSSKRTTTYDRVDETLAVGTTISGETVALSAGRDMSLIAAQVAGTGDVSLAAGRDLLIGGAQETYSATHDTKTQKSGLFGSGGIGVTWGTRETRNTADIEETTHIGSLIGSSAGRVDIVAGGDIAIVGSDVLSKAGIGISGENVAIVAADSTMSVEERQTMRQSGLNISLSGGVIDTAMAVYGAARRANEVDDDRLAALYAAKAGQTFAGAGNMATDASGQFSALANTDQNTAGGGGSSGINLRIGYGASSSTSTSELAQNTHTGSRIGSEGDVSIVARSGDLAVVGSTIDGDNIALVAANDILLRSSQDVSTHTSRSESQSGEVGITIGTEAGIGVYVAAAMAKGRGDGSGLVHNETVVTAANGLTFVSGNDTTLQGAQLIGETVTGRVGGNFTLISEQDADYFDRKDTSISGSAAIGAGGGSANIAFSQSKVNSEYLSVREQTGVQAGSGGFDIEVGGHTQLDGAALASAGTNNRLSTGTLGWSDLENRAEYDASSISFSAGTSGNSSGSSGSFSPGLSLPQSDSASSTTRAGIAVGTIEVRDGAVDLSGLNRDVTALQQEGLSTIFDEQKVAERMEMGQVAGEVGFAVAKDIVESGKNKAAADLLKAGQDAAFAEAAGDEEAFAEAKARASQANAVLQSWSDGGTRKQATQMLTGAVVAGLGGGNALAGAAGVFVNEQALSSFSAFLNGKGFDNDGLAHSALMAAGGLALGATGGALLGDAGSGAVAGSTAQQQGYFDYRDGRQQTGDLLRGLLEEFAQTNPEAAQGMQEVVDRAITAGGDPDAIAAVLLMPGGLQTLQEVAVAETAALKQHGRPFDALSPSEQHDLLVSLYRAGQVTVHPGTAVASEGGTEVPTGLVASESGVTTTPDFDPTFRTQVGSVLSGVVISGGQGVEKAVNWMGEDVAMGASFLLMSALGGPAKAAGSVLFHASPVGEWTQGVKDEYAVVPLAGFFGRYGFGATTDEALFAVNPASHAMSSVTVDTLLSSFGIVGGREAARNIVDSSKGFGNKVQSADGVGLNVGPVKALDVDSQAGLRARAVVGDNLEHDHIPSFAAIRLAKENELGRQLSKEEAANLYRSTVAIEVPRDVHRAGRTHGGRNTPDQIAKDAADLCGAVCRDTAQLRQNLVGKGYEPGAVDEAIRTIIERNRQIGILP